MYKTYSLLDLCRFTASKIPTPVNLVLDQTAIDFLLSLNTNNRTLNRHHVQSIIESIRRLGWKQTDSFCVTTESWLGNGQHRLTALRCLGYPKDIFATVIFGVDRDSVLVIDQHSKRTVAASVKLSTGKKHTNYFLAAIRHDLLMDPSPGVMSMSNDHVSTAELAEHLEKWEQYSQEMPLLFHQQTFGVKTIRLTSAMIVAVVHYRRRAGVATANHFLNGFWGIENRPAHSAENKALHFRLTSNLPHGISGSSYVYQIFVGFLLAHYEGRRNPCIKKALHWGRLSYNHVR